MLGLSLFMAQPAMAQDFCAQYIEAPSFYKIAIHTVASAMKYTDEQLCNLSTLADIQIQKAVLPNEENQAIDHTWVTLHYAEYSCQYFVRNSDQVITKKNCYNTW